MTDEPERSNEHDAGVPAGESGMSQRFRHTPLSARVPEKVRCGVFSTGTMILQTGDEFIIDFLSTIVPPQQVVSRVVLSAATFAGTVPALQSSIAKYEEQFGKLKLRQSPTTAQPPAAVEPGGSAAAVHAQPQPGGDNVVAAEPGSPSPPVDRLYDDLKFPDELLGGCYANAVMIRHTADEFCFDFITNFYPRSAVTSRVYLAVGRVPSFFDAMASALKKYQCRTSEPPPA